MIDQINNVLFLHIPRTGGSRFYGDYHRCKLGSLNITWDHFMEAYVGIHNRQQHFKYCEYLKHFDSNINIREFYKFCIVRNPWDLVLSSYFLYEELSHPLIKTNNINSFDDFVSKLKQVNDSHATHDMLDYLKFCTFLNGCEDCKIVKYEKYSEGLSDVCKDLGIKMTYKKFDDSQLTKVYNKRYKKKRRSLDYKDYYNNRTKDAIWKMLKNEIERFDYEFTT
tara:strand:- start:4956 stop:5624 length:669 start_codon:yes stop_codon:yes gene_type:complete